MGVFQLDIDSQNPLKIRFDFNFTFLMIFVKEGGGRRENRVEKIVLTLQLGFTGKNRLSYVT